MQHASELKNGRDVLSVNLTHNDSTCSTPPTSLGLLHAWFADHIGMGGFYKDVGALECTQEDAAAAIAFAEAYVDGEGDDGAFKVFWMTKVVLCRVAKFMRNYGETGFGDKPPALNRVTYWAQHIDATVLDAAVQEINRVPIEKIAVFENDKSPSASPKCKLCKTKIGRGELALRLTNVEFCCNTLHTLIELKPTLKCNTRAILCPCCVDEHGRDRFLWPHEAHRYGATPVQRGVSHANQPAADALCRLAVVQLHASPAR